MNKTLTVSDIQGMSTDHIVDLYRNGYRIEDNTNSLNHNIVSTQGISISTGVIFLIGLGILAYLIYKK